MTQVRRQFIRDCRREGLYNARADGDGAPDTAQGGRKDQGDVL